MNRKLFPALVGILSACLASTAYAQPLMGSGDHLPHLPLGEPPNELRVIIWEDFNVSFIGEWTAPALPDWWGTFHATGPIPAGINHATGLTTYDDFSDLALGYLPAGTMFAFGDVDFGSGTQETFTLNAWDLNGIAIKDPWLNVPNGVWGSGSGPDGNPANIDMPGWDFNAMTGEYFIDGTTVRGNPVVSFMLPTNQDISVLTVYRNSEYANFRLAAPVSEPDLDIKPGSCPNSFNRNSHGVLPVALVGTESFDVTQVDLDSILLKLKDDPDGPGVPPHEGPPGPHTTLGDSATPFAGEEQCDCHELEGDGVTDLNMKFKTADVVAVLGLDDFSPGALVSLTLTGTLNDGTPFTADDCIRLVPPGTPPGMLAVTSNLAGAWIDVSPLDLQLDGGGFAGFDRTFPLTSVVTLTTPQTQNGWTFLGWRITGLPQPSGPGGYAIGGVGDSAPADELIPGTSIELTMLGLIYTVEAVYEPPEFSGPPAPGVADRP